MTKSGQRRFYIYLALLCLLFISTAIGCKPKAKDEQKETGAELTTGPPKGGDFTLQAAEGPFSLHDMKGKVVLIFFGYTSCPTACPTSLETMAEAFSRLSVEELERVQGVFISFDPERDTVDELKEYAGYFHPNIIGMSGKIEEVKEVAGRYGAFFIKALQEESEMGYGFSHSTETYLVADNGTLSEIYSEKTDAMTLSEAIRRHLWKRQ
ncbi:MAG: SCO family protein [Proteobacteria bacterium]|nr:SCO family protein [Pseudomonadota bacterium]